MPAGAPADTQPGTTPRARQRTSGRSLAMRDDRKGLGPPGRTAGVRVPAGAGAGGRLGGTRRVTAQGAFSSWVRPSGAGGRAPETLVISSGAGSPDWGPRPPGASSSAEDSGGRRGPGGSRRGAPGGWRGAWGRTGSLGRRGTGPARAAGRGRSLALAEGGRSLYCAGLGEGGGGARRGGRTGKRPGAPLRWATHPRGGAEGRPFSSCDRKWRRESSDQGPGL